MRRLSVILFLLACAFALGQMPPIPPTGEVQTTTAVDRAHVGKPILVTTRSSGTTTNAVPVPAGEQPAAPTEVPLCVKPVGSFTHQPIITYQPYYQVTTWTDLTREPITVRIYAGTNAGFFHAEGQLKTGEQ